MASVKFTSEGRWGKCDSCESDATYKLTTSNVRLMCDEHWARYVEDEGAKDIRATPLPYREAASG